MQPVEQPNPYVSHFFSDITYALYTQPEKYLERVKNSLISRNSALWKNNQTVIQYLGKFYWIGKPTKSTQVPNPLKPQLLDEWRSYEQQVLKLEKERHLVMGYVQTLLLKTHNPTDIKALLPESLPFKQMTSLVMFPFDAPALSESDKTEFARLNKKYLEMMRIRMVDNLIIGESL